MKEIHDIIRFWEARRGQPLALATLVAARGSSYRRPGARMLFSALGDSAGGVSAGCIEEEVISCAPEVLRSGQPQLLTFDTRLRFGCHGTIDILLEPLAQELMVEIHESVRQRQPLRLETVLRGDSRGTRIAGFDLLPESFVQTIDPVLRLVLVGDSSEIDSLRAYAGLLGWEVLQLENPPVPGELLDPRTAVLLASHNFGRDCAALRDLLPAGLKYLGLVGSRRRRDDILFDVMHHDVALRSALFAPAGLHLGTDSPEQIALSIAAEIQSVFGAGTSLPLRSCKTPIHQPAAALATHAEPAA